MTIDGLAKPVTVSRQISGMEQNVPVEGEARVSWPPQLARLLVE